MKPCYHLRCFNYAWSITFISCIWKLEHIRAEALSFLLGKTEYLAEAESMHVEWEQGHTFVHFILSMKWDLGDVFENLFQLSGGSSFVSCGPWIRDSPLFGHPLVLWFYYYYLSIQHLIQLIRWGDVSAAIRCHSSRVDGRLHGRKSE